MSRHGYSLRRDTLLWALLAVFALFSDLHPARMVDHPGLVDWPTIATLTGLLLIIAGILLSKYSHDWRSLAWGADVGGFGLVIGSLANLIALRLGRQPGGFWAFHARSLPFFLCTVLGTGLWLAVASG